MVIQTGKFAQVEVLMSALWLSLSTKSTFELQPPRGLRLLVRIHPANSFMVLPQALHDPPLHVTFKRPDSLPKSPATSSSRISIAPPPPLDPASNAEASVAELRCKDGKVIDLAIELLRAWTPDRRHPWPLQLKFLRSPHEPRLLMPRP